MLRGVLMRRLRLAAIYKCTTPSRQDLAIRGSIWDAVAVYGYLGRFFSIALAWISKIVYLCAFFNYDSWVAGQS